MGDIITTFSKIGSHYLDDEKRVKNKAFEYDRIKVYLFDIKTGKIEPSLNIKKEELIVTRYGIGANSGNLFPNIFFKSKDITTNFEKFVRAIDKSNKNLLSFFEPDEIEENEILKCISKIENHKEQEEESELSIPTLLDFVVESDQKEVDDNLIVRQKEQIQNLEEYKKERGGKEKVATFFALSYDGLPVSAYFQDIYEKHLNKSSKATMKGYDILSNQAGIGGDANLAFCSTNEMPTKLKPIKLKLLPLSFDSAKRVKIGFDVMDKMLSHNFHGLKIAILPTLLSDEIEYKSVLEILESSAKGEISEIRESETYVNEYLEDSAYIEKDLPVLNTILFYAKNNSAVDVLLQIDDILPSYISHISDMLGKYNIKAFKNKESKDADGTLYMQNIFDDRLEIMSVLLSPVKLQKDILVHKFSRLIYWGTVNKSYAYPVEWGKYFNDYYYNRSIKAIVRYLSFFDDTDKLKEHFILQKGIDLQAEQNIRQSVEALMDNSPFLNNDVLKSAYLLGMLSGAVMNWQYGVSSSSSYEKWLNNSGAITKDSLDRIWKKSEETIRKLNSTSGSGNKMINEIKELVVAYAQKAFVYRGIVKSSYVSLAFAMGGSDYTKHIKKSKEEK